jgi:hypothetical protein
LNGSEFMEQDRTSPRQAIPEAAFHTEHLFRLILPKPRRKFHRSPNYNVRVILPPTPATLPRALGTLDAAARPECHRSGDLHHSRIHRRPGSSTAGLSGGAAISLTRGLRCCGPGCTSSPAPLLLAERCPKDSHCACSSAGGKCPRMMGRGSLESIGIRRRIFPDQAFHSNRRNRQDGHSQAD